MKKISILLFLISMSFCVFAQDTIPEKPQEVKQEKQKTPLKDKIYFGGGIGLSIGTYTRISIYPMIGYKLTNKLSGGIEIGYEYISDNRYSQKYTTSNWGGSIFARYRVIPQLFLQAEYAMYNYDLYYVDLTNSREWVPFLFLGGGYSQNIGGRTWAYASVKFDVLQNSNSPYNNWAPFWSVGVSHGF